MIETSKGLNHMNEQGMVHNDFKPANSIVVNGEAKVGDLGAATKAGKPVKVCTKAYAAPEVKFLSPTSSAQDVWSNGVSNLQIRSGKQGIVREIRRAIKLNDVGIMESCKPK